MHKAAPPLLPLSLQGWELLGGFGEPREQILFKLTLLFPWFVLLFWFGFVPSGWFWLADFTTCSFKYKFHPWGGDRARTRSVVIR